MLTFHSHLFQGSGQGYSRIRRPGQPLNTGPGSGLPKSVQRTSPHLIAWHGGFWKVGKAHFPDTPSRVYLSSSLLREPLKPPAGIFLFLTLLQ
jgi:hypothetical protein